MDALGSLFLMIVFIAGAIILLSLQTRIGLTSTGMKIRRAVFAPWGLSEFLSMKQNRWKINQYYYFSEEFVRSLGHRFVGKFDGAVLHWEDKPILDLIVEYKFPVKYLPKEARKEDILQSGLYALALLESGVSCSSTRLVTIYCLQDEAKRCLALRAARECWRCSDGRIYVSHFKSKSVLKDLRRLDEVWYNGRQAKPTRKRSSCSICPYSIEKCNYSLV